MISVRQWLAEASNVGGSHLYEAKKATKPYVNVKGPSDFTTRYVVEDLITGLVPMSELAKAAGVNTPIMDATIDYLCTMTGVNYREIGRTLKKLGLEGKSTAQIIATLL